MCPDEPETQTVTPADVGQVKPEDLAQSDVDPLAASDSPVPPAPEPPMTVTEPFQTPIEGADAVPVAPITAPNPWQPDPVSAEAPPPLQKAGAPDKWFKEAPVVPPEAHGLIPPDDSHYAAADRILDQLQRCSTTGKRTVLALALAGNDAPAINAATTDQGHMRPVE